MEIFPAIRPVSRTGVMRDALAGLTLAAMNVPQALGYTKIAGMSEIYRPSCPSRAQPNRLG